MSSPINNTPSRETTIEPAVSQKTSKNSKLAPVLSNIACLTLVGTIAVGISLFFLGLPLWVNIVTMISLAAIVIFFYALACTCVFRKISEEYPSREITLRPPVIEELQTEIPDKPLRVTRTLTKLYSTTSEELPEGIEIPEGSAVEVYTLKNTSEVRLITAQAPCFPTIREDGEGVSSVYFLPPYTKDEEGTPLQNTALLNLKTQLSEDCWSKAFKKMLSRQVLGNWESFIWGSPTPDPTKDPKKLILAWGPWGWYQEDLDIINQTSPEKTSPHVMNFSHYPERHNIACFKKLLKELILAGETKIHFHAPTIFSPKDWSNRLFYNVVSGADTVLKQSLLIALDDAIKEILEKGKGVPQKVSLFITHPENNPLNRD